MKKVIISILSLLFFLSIAACSKDANPQIRVTNKLSENVSFVIQVPGETEIRINDVTAGTTTEYRSSLAGNVTATAIIQNQSISFNTVINNSYTIVLSDTQPLSVIIE
jgi:hypothetical protein